MPSLVNQRRTILGIGLAIILLAVDRYAKWYATHLLPREGVFWIPRLLGLERYENHGIAFSLPLHQQAILISTVLIVIVITRHILSAQRSTRTYVALAFLLLGAASNFVDRLFYSYVIDYLRIGPLSLVNIADGMVIAGLVIALWPRKKTSGIAEMTEQHHHA